MNKKIARDSANRSELNRMEKVYKKQMKLWEKENIDGKDAGHGMPKYPSPLLYPLQNNYTKDPTYPSLRDLSNSTRSLSFVGNCEFADLISNELK